MLLIAFACEVFGLLQNSVCLRVVLPQLVQLPAVCFSLFDLGRARVRFGKGRSLIVARALFTVQFAVVEAALHNFVLAPQIVDLAPLLFVAVCVVRYFIFLELSLLRQRLLLFVVLVLERQKVFIKWNSVAQQRLVAARLILLVHFFVLKKFDLRLHHGHLLLKHFYVFGLDLHATLLQGCPLGPRLLFHVLALQVAVAFELLVSDGPNVLFVLGLHFSRGLPHAARSA